MKSFLLASFFAVVTTVSGIFGIKSKPPQQSISCKYDLRLSEIKTKLENNQAALNIIKNNCLWLMGNLTADLQQKGSNNLVFWTSGAGCASCHAQAIYVLSVNKIIFHKELDDPQISVTKADNKNLLVIKEPIRKQGEALCCPSKGLKTMYMWDDKKSQFNIFSQQSEVYPQNPSTKGVSNTSPGIKELQQKISDLKNSKNTLSNQIQLIDVQIALASLSNIETINEINKIQQDIQQITKNINNPNNDKVTIEEQQTLLTQKQSELSQLNKTAQQQKDTISKLQKEKSDLITETQNSEEIYQKLLQKAQIRLSINPIQK